MGQATGLEAPPAKAKSFHFTAEGRPGQFGTVGFATVPGYTPARLGKARPAGMSSCAACRTVVYGVVLNQTTSQLAPDNYLRWSLEGNKHLPRDGLSPNRGRGKGCR